MKSWVKLSKTSIDRRTFVRNGICATGTLALGEGLLDHSSPLMG
jgi:hypothetical protein